MAYVTCSVRRAGLLREPNSAVGRQVYLTLTPYGESVLGQLAAAHREELRRLGPELRALLDRLGAGTE